jgi:hypothetical protein
MSTESATVVQRVGSYCSVLRDGVVSYGVWWLLDKT